MMNHMPSKEDINNAIDHVIKVASQYPDDNLARAIDDVRVIVRRQEIYIVSLEQELRKLKLEKEDDHK